MWKASVIHTNSAKFLSCFCCASVGTACSLEDSLTQNALLVWLSWCTKSGHSAVVCSSLLTLHTDNEVLFIETGHFDFFLQYGYRLVYRHVLVLLVVRLLVSCVYLLSH